MLPNTVSPYQHQLLQLTELERERERQRWRESNGKRAPAEMVCIIRKLRIK